MIEVRSGRQSPHRREHDCYRASTGLAGVAGEHRRGTQLSAAKEGMRSVKVALAGSQTVKVTDDDSLLTRGRPRCSVNEVNLEQRTSKYGELSCRALDTSLGPSLDDNVLFVNLLVVMIVVLSCSAEDSSYISALKLPMILMVRLLSGMQESGRVTEPMRCCSLIITSSAALQVFVCRWSHMSR